jgi:thiamine biosynthesis lipoprotein
VWKDDSQATRINELAATRPVQASQDVIDLIVMTQDLHTRTHGAFDVTVGPLVDLWGYYRKENHLPTQEEVDKAMALVGMDKVAVDREGRSVSFSKEGVRLDFGGIGKGLAVDAAAAVFRKYKIASVLINGGSSSILAIGAPPGKDGWDVKVTLPETENEVIAEVVLKDESISTSGCYGKYIEFDGAKYCHIFDPRTGWPAPGVTSATSFCASAAEADGLSTAFVVLGKEGTEQYCREHPEVKALIVPSEGATEPMWINGGEEKVKAL